MNSEKMKLYETLLRKELLPALGCTEPGAVGYAAAKAADVLGEFPEHLDMHCSANIIKNVKSVTVPNSGGMMGIEAAAVLGMLAGDPNASLEIFKNADDDSIGRTKELINDGFCTVYLQEGEGSLYIHAKAVNGDNTAEVIIKGNHTNIIFIKHNDQVLLDKREETSTSEEFNTDFMNVTDIVAFAETAELDVLKELMEGQIRVNCAIGEEGLARPYGANVGKTILQAYGDDVRTRARAKAAAGSDARMGGSSMPVVINSGSGNQGITLTIPVVEYANELHVGEERMYRALTISNLISIHIKKNIGKLSAFCGAVSAACGCGAAITYMCGGDVEKMSATIVNTLGNVGGIFCDGAKASCAAKIATSVDAAIMGHEMAMRGMAFRDGEGIVTDSIEETIENFGIVGREGMFETDISIMKLMINC